MPVSTGSLAGERIHAIPFLPRHLRGQQVASPWEQPGPLPQGPDPPGKPLAEESGPTHLCKTPLKKCWFALFHFGQDSREKKVSDFCI